MRVAVVLIGVAIFAAACGGGTSQGQNTGLQGQAGTGITIVHLPDARHTECAVMNQVQGGSAISCDWGNP